MELGAPTVTEPADQASTGTFFRECVDDLLLLGEHVPGELREAAGFRLAQRAMLINQSDPEFGNYLLRSIQESGITDWEQITS